jgi:hypothetical protein
MALYLWQKKGEPGKALFWILVAGFFVILSPLAASAYPGMMPELPQGLRDLINSLTSPTIYTLGTTGLLVFFFVFRRFFVQPLVAWGLLNLSLLGMGLAMIGRSLGDPAMVVLGFSGAVLHVVNHATFKGLLFLGAGAVHHATGTRELDRLGGLSRAMPLTAALFLVGAAAICGLPPLNGFASEWLVYLASFRSLANRAVPGGAARWTGWNVDINRPAGYQCPGRYTGSAGQQLAHRRGVISRSCTSEVCRSRAYRSYQPSRKARPRVQPISRAAVKWASTSYVSRRPSCPTVAGIFSPPPTSRPCIPLWAGAAAPTTASRASRQWRRRKVCGFGWTWHSIGWLC